MRDCIFYVYYPDSWSSSFFFTFFSNSFLDSDLWCLCLCSCFLCFISSLAYSYCYFSSISYFSLASFSRYLLSASSWFFFNCSSCSFLCFASAFFCSEDFLSLLAAAFSASSSSLLSESEPESDCSLSDFEVYSFLSSSAFFLTFFVVFLDSVSFTLIFTLVWVLNPASASFFEVDFY